MWQQILRNERFNNNNKHDEIIKIQCSFYVRVCVENTVMASSIKMICSPVCACLHVGKVYRINESIVGHRKEDKNWLYSHTCVCVYVYMFVTVSMGFWFSLVHTSVFYDLWWQPDAFRLLAKECRMLLWSVMCAMPSAVWAFQKKKKVRFWEWGR